MSLSQSLRKSKLIDWGFCSNQWVWFHILGGGLIARFLIVWLNQYQTIMTVLAIALLWEVIEYVFETRGKPAIIYGSVERWAWDTVGDILGSVACAALVIA